MAGNSSLPVLKGKRKSNKEKEQKIPIDVVGAARPTNTESERIKFFSNEEANYEPQFVYKLPQPILLQALRRYSVQVESRYVPHALRVLRTLLLQYGSYERYEEQNGGEVLQESEARTIVSEYLARHGVDQEISVIFDPHLVARASFTKKAATLRIRPQGLRRNWIQGMLHHEIGTHYLRDRNDKMQPWSKERNGRKKYRLGDKNPTEEGLASLHTVLEREGHFLWRAALLYYTIWRALQLSFRELYEDLAQFLGGSTDERWDYCVRAKRGLLDTSQPGGFVKDQCYLTGAMEILEQRHRIDFNALYIGKLSVVDAHRAKCTGLARLESVQLPVFLQNAEQKARYHALLDEMVRDNDLTDLLDHKADPPQGTGTRPSRASSSPLQGSRSGSSVSSSRPSARAWTELPPVPNSHSSSPCIRKFASSAYNAACRSACVCCT
mmetsp:Transcript_10727/g.19934  ORF Transcript_10727/g.19934 Transcript_10727/m.19934 type:complete len:439 (-) Transcript_10727:42-1358(-)